MQRRFFVSGMAAALTLGSAPLAAQPLAWEEIAGPDGRYRRLETLREYGLERLAEAFGLQLVAEGVETSAAALTLMRHGCHRAQGFLLSPPLPSEAMESLLSTRWMPMPYLAGSEALAPGVI